jgi:hypothetical protein
MNRDLSVDLTKVDKQVTSGVNDLPLKSNRHVSVMMLVLLGNKDKRTTRSMYRYTEMHVFRAYICGFIFLQ